MAIADQEMLTRQIREAVDIVDLVGSYLPLRRAGANFKGLCPFHEEKTPSFNVHPAKQIFKCFGCGAGGDVFTFVQMKENVEFLEARRMLAERAGISLEQEVRRPGGGASKSELAQVNRWAQEFFRGNHKSTIGEKAREYVVKRGITAESAEVFGIGLAVDSFDALIRQANKSQINLDLLHKAGLIKESSRGGFYDTFRNRLMFPIRDVTGRIVGFGGRTLGDDPAKYLNSPATALFDKSNQLFGLDLAREDIAKAGRVIVVEGYTDCMMAHQFGFGETVATLGTAMTESHARLLRRYTDRVILLFDSDEAGRRATDRAISVSLSSGLDVLLARVPKGKDPCDYLLSEGKTGFESVLKAGIEALEFKWQQMVNEYDASTSGPNRRRAVEAYLQELASWVARGAVDPIAKGLLLNQLSKILSLPAEDLHRQLLKMNARSGAYRSRSSVANAPISEHGSAGHGHGAQEEAMRQIMEVLLNEPEHYPAVSAHFVPSAIRDPSLGVVAEKMVAMFESGRDFQVDDLISRLESVAYGRLVTDLQLRGECRGECAAAIEGAVACLKSYEQSRQAAMLAREIRSGRQNNSSESDSASTGEDERLQALSARAKNPHFSSGKARRKFLEL